jgi:L-fuconate dehydratase
MNVDPDYSAAYVTLTTDGPHQGHGLVFTLGRGTELCVAAVETMRHQVVGRDLESIVESFGAFWRQLTNESQLRWLGPEKGVTHLAAAGVINALWDLWARCEEKPVWKLLADMPPEQCVRCVDFRYITDAISPDEALELLDRNWPSRQQRIERLGQAGYPAYTTSAGWLGYDDDQLRRLCRAAVDGGWQAIKVKVGGDLQRDRQRLSIARQELGPARHLMLDANQVWDVPQAITWLADLARFQPYWIEEPTSPDDVLGHATIARSIAPIRVASGEMAQNRVIFKQLLQAQAIHFCQIDACRLGGVNEALAVMLMAAKYKVPICPHGGGVGLCEQIQHLSFFDYIALSATMDDRWIEYVDHLHEHFAQPVTIGAGRYQLPLAPGYGTEFLPSAIERFRFPNGSYWRGLDEKKEKSEGPM